MKEKVGYCHWYGSTMEQITEQEQDDCDYQDVDCEYCYKYDNHQFKKVGEK